VRRGIGLCHVDTKFPENRSLKASPVCGVVLLHTEESGDVAV